MYIGSNQAVIAQPYQTISMHPDHIREEDGCSIAQRGAREIIKQYNSAAAILGGGPQLDLNVIYLSPEKASTIRWRL